MGVADAAYAAAHGLKAGSAVSIAGARFTVIGLVRQAPGSNPPQLYVPLARAQTLASGPAGSLKNKVNIVYVQAASAADVGTVTSEISRLLPSATVTNSASLASGVTGSLKTTAQLARSLGTWLAVLVLLAAVAMASLLTVAAVARRVREFGTLKALGWRSGRITGQVMGETIAMGIAGAAAGIALGLGGAAAAAVAAPKLTATVQTTNTGQGGFGGGLGSGGAIFNATDDWLNTGFVIISVGLRNRQLPSGRILSKYSPDVSVPLILLGLLEREPSHGYDLKRDYDTYFGRGKPLRYSQVYATLGRLTRDGKAMPGPVEQAAGPERRRHVITDAGIGDVDGWLSEPVPPEPDLHSELFAKVVLTLVLDRPASRYLDIQRAAHLQRMRELTNLKSRGGDPLDVLLADHALYRLEGDLRWIDHTAARLHLLARSSPCCETSTPQTCAAVPALPVTCSPTSIPSHGPCCGASW